MPRIQPVITGGLDDINRRRRHREVTDLMLNFQHDDSRIRTPAEIAAGVTPVNYAFPPGNAFRFMSDDQINDVIGGTLLQDVTVALNNWLASLGTGYYATSMTGTVAGFLPAGKYRITSTIAIPQLVWIFGVPLKSTIVPDSSVTTAMTVGAGATVESIVINGTNTSGKTGMSLGASGLVNNVTLRNVQCVRYGGSGGIGLLIVNAVLCNIHDSYFGDSNQTGCKLLNTGTATPTTIHFHNCVFKQNTNWGFWMRTGVQIRVSFCDFEGNGLEGLLFHNNASETYTDNLIIESCWFEANQQSLTSGATRHAAYQAYLRGHRPKIRDGHFEGNSNEARAMYFESCTGFVVDHCDVPNESGQIVVDSGSAGGFVSWPTTNGDIYTVVTMTGTAQLYVIPGQQIVGTLNADGGSKVTVTAKSSDDRLSVANNATGTRSYSALACYLLARDNNTGCVGLLLISVSTVNVVSAIANGGSTFTSTLGSAGNINVSVSGATISFENKTGGTAQIETSIIELG